MPAPSRAGGRHPEVPGREELVDELTDLAARAAAGSGSLVLLAGEAGIGKTSTASAVARRVRDDVVVSWGRCTADGSAPPFWPWRDVVDLEAATPTGAAEAAPAIGAPRVELLDALRAQLAEQRQPRLVVVEDLQWADVASVLLLLHVGGTVVDLPLVVVATLRTGEPMSAPLAEAIEDLRRMAVTRELPPLPAEVIGLLLREAGFDPDDELARAVRDRTGGNPLFVTELLRAARAAGPDGPADTVLVEGVPPRASELVGRQLARLPAAVAELVVTASVVGEEGDARTLAEVQGTSVEVVVDLLEQARAARLLDAARPGRWRFRHDLVRGAVAASAPDAVRARTHAAVLDALAAGATAPPPVLAHHALAAQPFLDAERAVALAAEAGAAALAGHAYEEAIRWSREALSATTPDLAPRWRAELFVRCGEAHRHLGQVEQARQAFADAAATTDDPALLARAALGYADPGADLGIAYRTEDPTTVDLLEGAIAAHADQDSATRVLLEARLAAELYFSDHPARARALIDDALARADRTGDQRALGAAGAVAHDAFVVGQAPLEVQLSGSAQLVAWAATAGSRAALLTAHRARAFDLLAAGDLAAMDAEILAFRRLADPLRAPGYLWWPALWWAMRALLEGRHDSAEVLATEACRIGEGPFPKLAFTNLSFLLFFLRREQGRLAEMHDATRDFAAAQPDVPAIRVALVLLLAETGRTAEARAMADAVGPADLGRLRDRNWPASWFQLARAAALLGDQRLARTLLADGTRPTERCVMVSLATVCLGAADLATAWLLHTLGELDRADERYRAAVDLNARIGARSWLTQARLDRARLLLDRDGPGDRELARRLADQAGADADDIGLHVVRPLRDELAARLDGGAGPAARPGRGDAPGAGVATFRRAGPVWDLDFGGKAAQVAHARGLTDIAALLARPGQAVSVLELLGDDAGAGGARGAEALDERARREIRARLHDLDEAEADAEAAHDPERAAAAREERQRLAEAVTRDLGLGGRSRRIGDPVERARKTVSTRIRRAIAAVGRAHPDLGRHLERSVDTGAWCAYRPAEPVRWRT